MMIEHYIIEHNKVPHTDWGNIHYIGDEPNDSMTRKCNRALGHFLLHTKSDWACIQHSDTEIRCEDKVIEQQLSLVYPLGCRVAGVIGTMSLHDTLQWWQPLRPAVTAGAIIQGYDNGTEALMNDLPGIRTDMASIDGCFMLISRDAVQQGLVFDDNLDGWHCYDVDLCINCLVHGWKVGVLNVVVKHGSEGKFDNADFEQCRQYVLNKWRPHVDFPIVSGVSKLKG